MRVRTEGTFFLVRVEALALLYGRLRWICGGPRLRSRYVSRRGPSAFSCDATTCALKPHHLDALQTSLPLSHAMHDPPPVRLHPAHARGGHS
jgi:hypothetical protein